MAKSGMVVVAVPESGKALLAQFRADFALVYRHERGYLNPQEHADAKAQAGRYVRERTNDATAMREMMTIFRGMADQIRHEQERAERIRSEVRAERRVAA